MEVCNWGEWPGNCENGSALTVGTFDGPHRGHAALFDAVFAFASGHPGVKTGVVTFAKPPAALYRGAAFPGLIVPLEKRLDFLQKKGLDFAIVVDFSLNFATMEGDIFLRLLKENLSLRFLAEGEAFKMGAGGLCTTDEIAKLAALLSFTFLVVPPVLHDGKRISSSRIREALLQGDVKLAEALLGRRGEINRS